MMQLLFICSLTIEFPSKLLVDLHEFLCFAEDSLVLLVAFDKKFVHDE